MARSISWASMSASVLSALVGWGCSGDGTPLSPEQPWKIADFQIVSDGSDCCPEPLGAALGILAATDCAMPGNLLKVAAGCRTEAGRTELGAVVELKVADREGRLEAFESLKLVTAPDCGDTPMTWGIASYGAIHDAARIWGVTQADDPGLCGLLDKKAGDRAVLLRALEEAALRKKCAPQAERLAFSDDEDVALRAVGTLGRIGSRDSIQTLGRLTLSGNPRMPWVATNAIADIGGPDALRALDIIAAQADTAELREAAGRLSDEIREAGRDR